MQVKMIKTTAGLRPFWFMTEREVYDLDNEDSGFCLACQAQAYGIEPDARRCKCESCGARKVYGSLSLFELGRLEIVDAAELEEVAS
jgi:hypothetical protein